MSTIQPSVLRRQAGDMLQKAPYDPKRLVLIHTSVALGDLFTAIDNLSGDVCATFTDSANNEIWEFICPTFGGSKTSYQPFQNIKIVNLEMDLPCPEKKKIT